MASPTGTQTGPGIGLDDSDALRQSIVFFALTLGISWTLWVPLAIQDTLRRAVPADLRIVPIVVGGFGPPLAAVLMTWRGEGSVRALLRSLLDWRHHPKWYLVALFFGPALIPVGSAMYAASGGVLNYSVLVSRLPLYPIQFAFVLVLGGGQEELGWRGFALPRLQAAYGATAASLIIGGVWAVWHLPLFAIPGSSQYGQAFLPYAVAVLGFSVLLTWLFNNTGGSVLLATLFHAGINASTVLYPVPPDVLQSSGFPDVVMLGMGLSVWAIAIVLIARHGWALSSRQNTAPTAASR